jgi:hypothetical protein
MSDGICAAQPCGKPATVVADVLLCTSHLEMLANVVSVPMVALLPEPIIELQVGTLERFAAKVKLGNPAGCLRWTTPNATGYGDFTLSGKRIGAHVASHLMFVGPVPEGWHVDHVRDRGCMHRDCVWWEHLEAVTPAENSRRGNAGRWQAEKTHCKHGHEFTPDNIYWIGPEKTMRACKTCALDAANERYRRLVNPNPDPRAGGLKSGPALGAMQRAKTHCPQGHEYTEENTYLIGPKNGRACKICCKARAAAQAARAREQRKLKAAPS